VLEHLLPLSLLLLTDPLKDHLLRLLKLLELSLHLLLYLERRLCLSGHGLDKSSELVRLRHLCSCDSRDMGLNLSLAWQSRASCLIVVSTTNSENWLRSKHEVLVITGGLVVGGEVLRKRCLCCS
jgi:hypothetical protein